MIDNPYSFFKKFALEDFIANTNVDGSFAPNIKNSTEYLERYKVNMTYDGEMISSILIRRPKNINNFDENARSYFFDLSKDPAVGKPFVFAQDTIEPCRGRGLSGYLIKFANKIYFPIFCSPLYSDTTFMNYPYQEKIIKPAINVWKKLVKEGIAEYAPEDRTPRWRMKV